MTPFCQRLRHPFRRPVHYYTFAEPSRTPAQIEKQREVEMQRALDEIENDLDDGRSQPGDSSSPDNLPVISDRGPNKGCFYPRDQLYFNSIMLATDADATYSSLPGRGLRQETRRTPVSRPKGSNHRSPSPRPVPSEWLTASQNAENLRRWEQRNGISTTVSRSKLPSRMQSLPKPPSPLRGPIVPGTQEWDKFMDFPVDNFHHVDHGQSSKRAAEAPATTKDTASWEPVVAAEVKPSSESRTVDGLPQAQPGSRLSPTQTSLPKRLSDISPRGGEVTRPLTWASALNSILRDETVGSATRAAIMERLPCSSSGRRPELPASPADANLVPNFSYPIAASAFYDRVDAARGFPVQKEEEHEKRLPNGVRSDHCDYAGSNDALYRDPTPPNGPLQGGQNGDGRPLTNGVAPGHYPPSSPADSRDTDIDPAQRPRPPNLIPEQVSAVLHSPTTHKLTPKTASAPTPPCPDIDSPAAPAHLIHPSDTSTQETPSPHPTAYPPHLPDLLANLEQITDLSTRLLTQCRERELALYRKLLALQRRRAEKRVSLRRFFSARARWGTAREVGENGVSVCKGGLGKREFEALMDMAGQNVRILDEDVADVAVRVGGYLERRKGVVED